MCTCVRSTAPKAAAAGASDAAGLKKAAVATLSSLSFATFGAVVTPGPLSRTIEPEEASAAAAAASSAVAGDKEEAPTPPQPVVVPGWVLYCRALSASLP